MPVIVVSLHACCRAARMQAHRRVRNLRKLICGVRTAPPPRRDFFLWPDNYRDCKSDLVRRFGEVVRKAWNPRAFKGQVSPHELLQAIIDKSNKVYTGDAEADPVAFCSWLLNTVHLDLTGGHRKRSSIITQCFQVRCFQAWRRGDAHAHRGGEVLHKSLAQHRNAGRQSKGVARDDCSTSGHAARAGAAGGDDAGGDGQGGGAERGPGREGSIFHALARPAAGAALSRRHGSRHHPAGALRDHAVS